MSMPANEPAAANDHVIDQGLGLMGGADQTTQLPQQQEEGPKLNPAWDNLLGAIPQGLHGQMIPELKKWDQNYEQGIQKVHSTYAGYKPFLDGQISPEQLNEAYMIRQSMEQDPMKFVQAVMEFYKLQLPTEQGQPPADLQQDPDDQVFDVTQHPEFQRMQQMVELMGQHTLTQTQMAQQAQEDADLENVFQAAKQKHGDFDEQWVMQHLYASGHENADEAIMDQAVEAYKEHVQNIVQNYRSPSSQAPVLMGSGGGLPSQATPAGSMNGNQRRALVVQTLQNLNANSGG